MGYDGFLKLSFFSRYMKHIDFKSNINRHILIAFIIALFHQYGVPICIKWLMGAFK